uniref:Uncharacterized protein n=1 Tax=Arion vulgaris TaxID=1028688 RepID=A0A0B7AA76_9EUPU
MALTLEQFENLRLYSEKNNHQMITPVICFDIAADLKAQKGRGGRMFQRRKERVDKLMIHDDIVKFIPFSINIKHISSGTPQQKQTSWNAPLVEHDSSANVAFSHTWNQEKAQPFKQTYMNSPAVPEPIPAGRSSLKLEEPRYVLKGSDFNRKAKGWIGGGDYQIAKSLHHISPTRQHVRSKSCESVSRQQNFSNKANAWPPTEESEHTLSLGRDWSRGHRAQKKHNLQPKPPDDASSNVWAEHTHAVSGKWASSNNQEVPRVKIWQSDSYVVPRHGDEIDYNYPRSIRNIRYEGNHTVAYQQPIIPGTDL